MGVRIEVADLLTGSRVGEGKNENDVGHLADRRGSGASRAKVKLLYRDLFELLEISISLI